MGTSKSIYEKPGTLNYYRFSAEEYALVKEVWSGIEINPQFYGNACLSSFCKTYPQYAKFFTLESNLLMNLDGFTMSKFVVIMDTMSYLLLDFNDKPKRLDRFVGYIAMVHKDMRLDETDMYNLVTFLFEYLSQTYPTQMTPQCRKVMSRFMDRIIRQLSIKMEAFRRYDDAQSDSKARSKLPCRQCPFFGEPMIFGKTKLYWDDWKKQWDEQFNEWEIQAKSFVGSDKSMLEWLASVHQKRQQISDMFDSKFSSHLSKTNAVDHSLNQARNRRRAALQAEKQHYQQHASIQSRYEHLEAIPSTSQKNHHVNNLADVSKLQADTSIDESSKPRKTARERRRERLKINLE